MPYSSVSEVPDSVPKAKRKQWMEVWNSVYAEHGDESRAFASAWAAVGGKDKLRKGEKVSQVGAGYDETGQHGCQACGNCSMF